MNKLSETLNTSSIKPIAYIAGAPLVLALIRRNILIVVLIIAAIAVTVRVPMLLALYLLVLITVIKYPENINTWIKQTFVEPIQLQNIKKQRKLFARTNNFAYTNTVKFYSTYVGDDKSNAYGANYIKGEYHGISFWMLDYNLRLDTTNQSSSTNQMLGSTVQAIYLNNRVPNFIIRKKVSLLETAVSTGNVTIAISGKFKITHKFDEQYDVICSKSNQRDLLYFLTPELLELILQSQPDCIEGKDEMIAFYYHNICESAEDYVQLFNNMVSLGGEFIDNTKNFKQAE